LNFGDYQQKQYNKALEISFRHISHINFMDRHCSKLLDFFSLIKNGIL
jgi:hypothetical protein